MLTFNSCDRSEMSTRGSTRTEHWVVSFQLSGGGAIETRLKNEDL
jgi:hypothetical protein